MHAVSGREQPDLATPFWTQRGAVCHFATPPEPCCKARRQTTMGTAVLHSSRLRSVSAKPGSHAHRHERATGETAHAAVTVAAFTPKGRRPWGWPRHGPARAPRAYRAERQRDLRVSEQLHHYAGRNAMGQQERRGGVPGVMQT